MINGTTPVAGKQVYDITLGYGKIISVEPDDAFTVHFGGNKRIRYSAGGYAGNVRRVYWENPVVVEPVADDDTWQVFVSIARQIYKLVRKASDV